MPHNTSELLRVAKNKESIRPRHAHLGSLYQCMETTVAAELRSSQDMVSKVLQCATEESTNHDLRDRGYIYWRLLATNPEATKRATWP